MTELTAVDLAARLSRVVVARDGDEYVLGRPDLAVYLVVPEPGAVFVESLRAGDSLPEATDRASAVAGASVDGEDFLAGLAAAGLLDQPSERDGDTDGPPRSREIRWIEGISPQAARHLFGPVAWFLYGLAALFVLLALVVREDLRPSIEHMWWLPDPALSILTVTVIGFVTAGMHEAWHWLAGRAVGVPAIFRVSYRGTFLVFETDMTQIVTIPRRRRYSPLFAGMAFDATVLAVALALRLAYRADLISFAGWLDRLLGAVVLIHVFRIVWQWAALFMRSDGYAILANALRCHDLYRATWLTTKDRLWRLSDTEAAELASIGAHDRRVARGFGFCFLAGMIIMIWMTFALSIPFMVAMLGWVSHNLANPSLASVAFWESAAVAAVLVGTYAVIPLLAARERRLRRRGSLR